MLGRVINKQTELAAQTDGQQSISGSFLSINNPYTGCQSATTLLFKTQSAVVWLIRLVKASAATTATSTQPEKIFTAVYLRVIKTGSPKFQTSLSCHTDLSSGSPSANSSRKRCLSWQGVSHLLNSIEHLEKWQHIKLQVCISKDLCKITKDAS